MVCDAGGVADDGDEPDGAVREPGQVADVVAGVDGVAELGQLHPAGEVADRVLDRDDGVEPLGRLERLEGDLGAGATGDVVEHHRDVGGPADLGEVVQDAGLAGLVVVRRDEQQPVGADLGRLLGELDRVGRGVGADAGDHGRPVAHGVLDGGEDRAVLLGGRGRRLARRTGDDDAVVAVVDQVGRDPGGAVEVDRPVGVERRGHGSEDVAERSGGHGRHR